MSAPLTFPRTHRLRLEAEYARVYDARTKQTRGPIAVFAVPNELKHCRFGLSISRKVGNAVRRNRLRRQLRESFRQLQHDFPGAYDLVVTARAHDPATLEEYRGWLADAVAGLHSTWQRRKPTENN